MIEVEDLSKEYRVYRKQEGFLGSLKSLVSRQWEDKLALDAVNLRVERGEILGLIGSNGAGKTTLVKILSGIIPKASGKISVIGFDPWRRELDFRHKISLVMGQKSQLWWDLPAADCFDLIRVIYKIPMADYRARLKELSEDLEVESLLHIQIRRLSLGERMKMELIAALLHQPQVLFLDEPTIGLDIHAQASIRSFIKKYQKKYGAIIFLTSHYMEDIESLCKRVVILQTGRKIYDGRLDDLRLKHITEKSIQVKCSNEEEVVKLQSLLLSGGVESKVHGSFLEFKSESKNLVPLLNQIFSSSIEISDLNLKEPEISEVIANLMRGESL